MKKLLSYIFLLAIVGSLSSCGEELASLNNDPNNPSKVDLKLMLPEILSQSAFNEGTNPNRVAGIWMQQFFGLDAQQLAYNSYIAGPDVMNNFWGTGLYTGVLRSCDVMIKQAETDVAPFYAAVGKIVMANELGKATSFFGDIPYSEAFQGTENLKPAYESQESIYGAIQTLLDEAIATLSTDASGYIAGDLIYGGDAASWVAAANAFKARYYMHLTKRDASNYAKALTAVGNAFTSNGTAPSFQFTSSETANWSLAKFGIERPSTLGIHPNFYAMMEGDPRRSVYTTEDDPDAPDPAFSPFYFDGADGMLVWGRSDASVPMISYVELKFIEAEATAANGGDATAMLSDAITASFDLVGVPADADFIAAASADASVGNIVTEAYKAYFGFNFHETYSNWRRTGFPALSKAPDGANGFNPSGEIPTRYLYVESEDQTNSDNVEAAKARQGGALLDAKLWAFE